MEKDIGVNLNQNSISESMKIHKMVLKICHNTVLL